MAVTRSVAKSAAKPVREGVTLPMFVWEGTDKRGKKMKGESQARNMNMLRAELRRQGINPGKVKPKPKPLFGGAGKAITAAFYGQPIERSYMTSRAPRRSRTRAATSPSAGRKRAPSLSWSPDHRRRSAAAVAVLRPLRGRLIERGDEDRRLARAVERAVDVAVTGVDERGSGRVGAFSAVAGLHVDQLPLRDVHQYRSRVRMPGELCARLDGDAQLRQYRARREHRRAGKSKS
jgi:hypothetical protein